MVRTGFEVESVHYNQPSPASYLHFVRELLISAAKNNKRKLTYKFVAPLELFPRLQLDRSVIRQSYLELRTLSAGNLSRQIVPCDPNFALRHPPTLVVK